MTDNERALLRKLTRAVSTLCTLVSARDPFGTLDKMNQEIEALSAAVDKDAAPQPRKSR